ncbi:fungal-specific transcription factor domain-containing protein [Coniochaeta sp. 2T2.1]|nr:fungal-specific transcription factor domain-containing protein [Coniochaeta sp. 2T2.1]
MSEMDVDGTQAGSSQAGTTPADVVPRAQERTSTPTTTTKKVLREPAARRRTAKLACDWCHKKKTKCDGAYPCSNCKKRGIQCLWAGGAPVNLIAGSYTPEYVKWLEEKVSALSGSTKIIDDRRNGVPAAGQRISPPPASTPTPSVTPSQPFESSARFAVAEEVTGVNQYTNDQEFYGSSSSVALLARVGRSPSNPGPGDTGPRQDEPDAFLTSLHNPVFSQRRPEVGGSRGTTSVSLSSFPQCRVFIDGFFSTLHYIFPILDKALFMRRCDGLWAAGVVAGDSSFAALYFSVLSLGALVGPRSEEPIDGRDNLAWSRKLFEDARSMCSALGMVTDLEMVQCYFFLSKVTQNELNPHLTYMYVGLAVRTALAIGINRGPPSTSNKDREVIKAETRTWWGLYSLETELSFGMGRPDTLGADLFHNRPFPVTIHSRDALAVTEPDYDFLEPAHCAILEFMVDFSRIIRRIRHELYVPESPATRNPTLALQYAASIEHELDNWLQNLPEVIRPQRGASQQTSLKSAKEPQYVKKQKLVLGIRYHNLRILLFGSFLLRAGDQRNTTPAAQQCIQKCCDSAKETIDIIYETYRHHDFFRTWFYNTTYTVFAASMILLYMTQAGNNNELEPLSRYVEMAVEILEVMDESVIAVKSAGMIKRALGRVKAPPPPPGPAAPAAPMGQLQDVLENNNDMWLPAHHYWGSVNLLDGQLDESFPFQMDVWA